jgi:transcriptional regulator GlxA family with amidase domain
VCGYLESSEFLFAPCSHPPGGAGRATGGGGIASDRFETVREIIALVDAATAGFATHPGGDGIAVCGGAAPAHHSTAADSKGWLAALNDPIVGRALQLIHAEPSQRWTAERLAREAGSSRTVLRSVSTHCSDGRRSIM